VFLQKSASFAKNRHFRKNWSFLQKRLKIGVFCKNHKEAEKFAKIEKKSFLQNLIFGRGPGEFCKNPIGLSQKLCFLTQNPIFKHFCEIGNLQNF
jgi:hypothetical protein